MQPIEDLGDSAAALLATRDGTSRPYGSCFFIAPGIAMTALHVIQAVFTGWSESSNIVSSIQLIQFSNDMIFDWLVHEVYAVETADIAFLKCHKPSWWGSGEGKYIPPVVRLSYNPPMNGSRIRFYGFTSASDDNLRTVKSIATEGIVSSIEFGFSAPIRPRSYVEATARIHAGMSGGPCFDDNDHVVGVNVKELETEGPQYYAIAALIWQAMGVEIDMFSNGEAFAVGELFSTGSLQAAGYKRLKISKESIRLLKSDPDSFQELQFNLSTEDLVGSVDASVKFAADSLSQLRGIIGNLVDVEFAEVSNQIHVCLRRFFWELEAALEISLSVAIVAADIGEKLAKADWWERFRSFVSAMQYRANQLPLDEVDILANTPDIFELRCYARLARTGLMKLSVMTPVAGGCPVFIGLADCRKDQEPVSLYPDMSRLENYLARCLRLVNLLVRG